MIMKQAIYQQMWIVATGVASIISHGPAIIFGGFPMISFFSLIANFFHYQRSKICP